MRIDIHGHQIEVTPALREYVETKMQRLARHFDRPFELRTQLRIDKPQHKAEATLAVDGRSLHAEASGVDMYAAIDLLADKIDRQLVKLKNRRVTQNRNSAPAREVSLG